MSTPTPDRFFGTPITPLTRRRIDNFKANRRGYISLIIFLALFVLGLFAEFIANDKPILVKYDGAYYTPIFKAYPETTFGGAFPTEADYNDPWLVDHIAKKGWMIHPPIPWHHNTIDYRLTVPAPAPPSASHWVGTDDQGRDLLSRLIYGFRISVLFGLTLTVISTIIGIMAGEDAIWKGTLEGLKIMLRDAVKGQ